MQEAGIQTIEVVVANALGLHARPAALLSKTAGAYSSEVTLEKDGELVNAKSMLGIMMLSACSGTKLKITAAGDDAAAALHAIGELFAGKFGEE
ncbi:MAG: HPr family phosphocarrier protein [Victivallaceae bacterium]|nr:HPr family phosphocarrier protein [Victivallaceae bacterium]